ncbi:hypothetical protein BDY19DRAFT_896029 [Irpex rosettiformis]|uniref:Uncharacterized protein n=1 Tax=Irpex rosettiformis TaxID=378272 RepID=A0ACB8TVL0_9APHY|nr:hypothetical protein BDY19DRAFT_896029 [Irpex rosettiformis]
MSKNTAWTRGASTLPSDRIPTPKPSKQAGKRKEAAIPKSKAILILESLRDGLLNLESSAPSRDPTGGCYCQARQHELSKYNPICTSCGLILCTLNLPYYACPYCKAALHSPPARLSLLQTLEQSISNTLAQEEREREEAIEEARRAAGAFPTLAAATSGTTSALDSHPVNQPHKVLSLNSKANTVTLSSYTKRAPSQSVKAIPKEPQEPEPIRTRRPPAEVPCSSKPQGFERPWYNSRPGSKPAHYISPPSHESSRSGEGSGRKRVKREKAGRNYEVE